MEFFVVSFFINLQEESIMNSFKLLVVLASLLCVTQTSVAEVRYLEQDQNGTLSFSYDEKVRLTKIEYGLRITAEEAGAAYKANGGVVVIRSTISTKKWDSFFSYEEKRIPTLSLAYQDGTVKKVENTTPLLTHVTNSAFVLLLGAVLLMWASYNVTRRWRYAFVAAAVAAAAAAVAAAAAAFVAAAAAVAAVAAAFVAAFAYALDVKHRTLKILVFVHNTCVAISAICLYNFW